MSRDGWMKLAILWACVAAVILGLWGNANQMLRFNAEHRALAAEARADSLQRVLDGRVK